MFKHAFVRGTMAALINHDAVAFPDEVTATKVADYIASRIEIDVNKPIPQEAVRKVASELVAASDWIKRNQPHVKAASFTKLATWEDVYALAGVHVEDLMTKAAEGSTIEGGDKGNKEPTTGEGKMDMSARPDGYAEHSLGKTDVDTRPGTVGKEEPQPSPPSESPSGSNSVTEHSRTASVAALFRKAAEGSTILGGDKGNTEPTTGEGKMDMSQRPQGYATLPHQGAPGAMAAMIGGAAVIGKETPHPNAPSESPSGSNSLTQHSAKAAAEDPYLALFKKTANEIVQYIPAALSDETKIAHVRACMGLEKSEKAAYLGRLQYDAKVASEKAAVEAASSGRRYDGRNANQRKSAEDGALPPFMKRDDDDKKSDGDDKKSDGDGDKKDSKPPWLQDKIDDKKSDGDDKKSDDDKKEAALRDHVARISAALRGA